MSGKEDILDILLVETRATRGEVQATAKNIAALEVKITQLAETSIKLEKAIYGNGVPGLRSQVDRVEMRVQSLEELEGLKEEVDHITERHEAEDKERAEASEGRKDDLKRWRDFKWGMLTVASLLILDLLTHFMGFDYSLLQTFQELAK